MNVWTVVTDFGVASALILICKLIRTNFVFFQKFFIPVAMIAGFLGLILGANGANILPFSKDFSSYGGLLIAIVFASVGLATKFPSTSTLITRSGKLFTFNQIVTVSQWLVALIIGSFLFSLIWPDLPLGFGLIMPAGFMGGHGTAVAIGETFATLGWDDATTLALTSATFGIFAAIIGGLLIIKYGVKKGYLKGITPFEEMDIQYRKGLIKEAERGSVGNITTASSSVDVISIHLALILVVTVSARYLGNFLSSMNDFVSVPTFACAFLLGCLTRTILNKTKLIKYFDVKIFNHSASTTTDYLIVLGIASIKISILINYALPLALLMFVGTLLCLFLLFYVAPKMLGDNWFEKGVFSWGWMTGTVAMGILLLRIADPDRKTKILDDYAIAYVPGAVVDILLVSFMPALIMKGYLLGSILVLLAYILIIYFINIRIRKYDTK